jgi:tRNA threonylcarbamoyladenosine biosynthesis protein TsaB
LAIENFTANTGRTKKNTHMNDLILHIHTTAPNGFVALAENDKVLGIITNNDPLSHASFLQPAIKELLTKQGIAGRQISAICVANGPGSYTGLRVGLATAKGLCFGWQKPLIALNSLKIMAKAVQLDLNQRDSASVDKIWIAPMIDARRLEVFYGLYQLQNLIEDVKPAAAVLTNDFLNEFLSLGQIFFSGDGVTKWKSICYHENACFFQLPELVQAMSLLGLEAYEEGQFSSLAYLEPEYIKSYFSNQ